MEKGNLLKKREKLKIREYLQLLIFFKLISLHYSTQINTYDFEFSSLKFFSQNSENTEYALLALAQKIFAEWFSNKKKWNWKKSCIDTLNLLLCCRKMNLDDQEIMWKKIKENTPNLKRKQEHIFKNEYIRNKVS